MINPDEQASLEEERRFLLESLRDLERENAVGDIDDEDYRVLKNGYVQRAAQIIKVLDAGVDAREARPRASMKRRVGSVAVVVLIAGAVGWFVAGQSGQRLPGQTISGGSWTQRHRCCPRRALSIFLILKLQSICIQKYWRSTQIM